MPITDQSELTIEPVDSTLKTGDIFMEDTNEQKEVDREASTERSSTERARKERSPFEKATELVSLVHESSVPKTISEEHEKVFLSMKIPQDVIDKNRETPEVLFEMLEERVQLIEEALGEQEEYVPPDTRAITDAIKTGIQELMEAIGLGQSAFMQSELAQMSKDVPPSFTYTYTDANTGQEVEKTVDLTRLTAAGTMAEAAEATKRNILKGVERVENLNSFRSSLTKHIDIIEKEDEYEVIRKAVDGFIDDVDQIVDLMSQTEKELLEFKTKRGRLNKLSGEEKMSADEKKKRVLELKGIAKEWAPYLRGHYMEMEEKGMVEMPKDLEDLVKLARSKAEAEFAKGGPKDLIDEITIEEADGTKRIEERTNLAHFYEWVRHQMWRVHDFNSTSEANFFSDEGMGVKTTYRTINFFEMVFTPSFFKQKRSELTHFFDKKKGKWVTKLVESSNSNEEYDKLREALLYEVYIFQLMRNGDFVYRDNMAGVKGMTQAMEGIFKTNPITKDDYLERILSMSSMSRTALGEKDTTGGTIIDKLDNNFMMGDAVRTAWSSYFYIWDYKSVAELLGSDSAFFQKEYDQYDDKGGKKGRKLKGGAKEEWFDENGKFRLELNSGEKEKVKEALVKKLKRQPTNEEFEEGIRESIQKRKDNLMHYMNVFHGPSKDQGEIKEIRERVVLSLMHKKGISYNEAKLAEAWAFSLQRFTGVAARNDTESVGFDQWTKQTNLEEYRQRQISERRRAEYGSKYTMAHPDHNFGPGLKRVTLTFAEAVRDTKHRAIYELMQGGRGGRIDMENNPIKKDIDFERNYQKDEKGNYIFADYNGRIVPEDELKKLGFFGINRFVIDDDKKVKFQIVTRNEAGEEVVKDVEPYTANLRPLKRDIIFRDADGNVIESLSGRAVNYSLDEKGKPTFYDINGSVVDAGENKPRVVEREVNKIEFGQDTMRQFTANIIGQSTEWYEDIIQGKDMGFLEMFKGYNSTGKAIIDTDKLNELRGRRRKNITYALSTWKGTDYTKTIRTWWKDKEGGDLQIKEQSILESMFGEEVLAFIQMEVWSKRRAEDEKIKEAFKDSEIPLKDINIFKLADYHDVLTDAQKDQLKICIWTGVFTYTIAKDIWRHRAIDSNDKRWSFDEVKQVYGVLEDSGLLNEDELPVVQESTDTGTAKLFGQEFMQALGLGNLEGFWQMIQAMIKQQSLV